MKLDILMRAVGALCITLFIGAVHAVPGVLDPVFSGGVVEPRFGAGEDSLRSALVHPDGQLTLVGLSETPVQLKGIGIARLTATGAVDKTFGDAGHVVVTFDNFMISHVGEATRLASGALIVSGYGYTASTDPQQVFVARILPDGRPDRAFGPSGTGVSALTPGSPIYQVNDAKLAITADGSIVVAARVSAGFAIARFTTQGMVDTAFGSPASPGSVLVEDTVGFTFSMRITVLADGSVLFAHTHDQVGPPYVRGVRLTPTGAFDSTYGTAGQFVHDVPPGLRISMLVHAPTGELYAFASTTTTVPTPGTQFDPLRFTPQGTLDTGYGRGLPALGPAFPRAANAAPPAPLGVRFTANGLRLAINRLDDVAGFGEVALDAQGRLDAGFANGGVRFNPFDQAFCDFSLAEPQADDAWIASALPQVPDLAACRFAQGVPDAAWGVGGRRSVDVGSRSVTRAAIGVLAYPDGSVLTVGQAAIEEPRYGIGLSKRLMKGGLDDSFAGGGRFIDRFVGSAYPLALAAAPGGRFVVAGITKADMSSYDYKLFVARYDAEGSRDAAAFGAGGVVTYDIPGGSAGAYALAVGPGGHILVAGSLATNTSDPGKTFVIRLLADGSLDATFGANGMAIGALGESGGTVSHLALQPDGRFLMTGERLLNGNYTPYVARFLANGTLDTAGFGAGTGMVTAVIPHPPTWISPVAVQADGKILAGWGNLGGIGVYRFLPDGTPDASFGYQGMGQNAYSDYSPLYAHAILPQADGRILVGGALDGLHDGAMAVTRLMPDGTIDPSFGRGAPDETPGVFRYVGSGSYTTTVAAALALAFDGKILVAGGNSLRHTVLRLMGDQATDVDADGIPDDVEVTVQRDPVVKDNDVFGNARLFAMQQYRDFLAREGEAGGVNFWTAQVEGGLARANVIQSFFGSGEFQGVGAPIARLYFGFFLRIPDYQGLVFQMNALRAGTPLAAVANNFSLSPEFQATYGALNNTQYVTLLYQNILGRTPVQAEIDYHVNRLATGASRGDVAVGFSESPEYIGRVANDVYVTMIYAGMLRRAPEPSGLDFWTSYMDAGNSGLALISGFLASQEYHDRFLP